MTDIAINTIIDRMFLVWVTIALGGFLYFSFQCLKDWWRENRFVE